MKKLTILLLILTLLLQMSACVSLSDTSVPATEPTPTPDNTPEDFPSQLKGMNENYEDATVEFIYVEGGIGTYTADSLVVDPESGDLTDSDLGVIERNHRIQEYLGATVESFTDDTLDPSQLYVFAKQFLDAQDPGLDVYAGIQYYDMSVATSAHLVNLNEIKNHRGETIINIKNDYWATDYINAITYNDEMYWVTGDLTLSYAGGYYCTFVNTDLYDQYVKSHYGDRKIYQVVMDGDWTVQTMLDMAALTYDSSKNAETDPKSGILYEFNETMDGFAFGCNVAFGKKTRGADGKDSIQITLATDPSADKLAKYLQTMTASPYAYGVEANDHSGTVMSLFAADKALFCFGTLLMAEQYLDDYENFAVIPYPKLDENQTDYYTGMQESVTVFGISRYSDCKELVAATLEAMAYYADSMVVDQFYQAMLHPCGGAHEEGPDEMLALLRRSCRTDFVAAWDHSMGDVSHAFRDQSGYSDFSSYVNTTYGNINTQLDELLTKLEQAKAKS